MQPVENVTRVFAAATPMRSKKKDAKRKKTSTRVQVLIFSKKVFTRKGSKTWAATHDYRSNDVDETDKSYRLRQRDPKRFKPNSFKTIELAKGIQATVGRLK